MSALIKIRGITLSNFTAPGNRPYPGKKEKAIKAGRSKDNLGFDDLFEKELKATSYGRDKI